MLFFLQIDWLNAYHKECLEKIGAELKKQGKNNIYKWLEEKTTPLDGGSDKHIKGGAATLIAPAVCFLLMFSVFVVFF